MLSGRQCCWLGTTSGMGAATPKERNQLSHPDMPAQGSPVPSHCSLELGSLNTLVEGVARWLLGEVGSRKSRLQSLTKWLVQISMWLSRQQVKMSWSLPHNYPLTEAPVLQQEPP